MCVTGPPDIRQILMSVCLGLACLPPICLPACPCAENILVLSQELTKDAPGNSK